MFDNLSDKLQRVFKNLRGEGKLTAANMEEALREIRVALLEADVHFKVVKQFIEQVKEKATAKKSSPRSRPASKWSKSSATSSPKCSAPTPRACASPMNRPPSSWSSACKVPAKPPAPPNSRAYLTKEGNKPELVSVDVYRPAARHQLSILAKQLGTPIYEGTPEETKPLELARAARRDAMQTGRDIVLVDTAGRQHIDEQLMQELQELKEALNPTEILFVADAMTGQDAVKSADEFHKRLGITGRHSHQDGWRRARRRGSLHPPYHRPAAEIRRRRRKNRRARNSSIPTASPRASWAWATCFRSSIRFRKPSTSRLPRKCRNA